MSLLQLLKHLFTTQTLPEKRPNATAQRTAFIQYGHREPRPQRSATRNSCEFPEIPVTGTQESKLRWKAWLGSTARGNGGTAGRAAGSTRPTASPGTPPSSRGLRTPEAAKSHSGSRSLTSDPTPNLARLPRPPQARRSPPVRAAASGYRRWLGQNATRRPRRRAADCAPARARSARPLARAAPQPRRPPVTAPALPIGALGGRPRAEVVEVGRRGRGQEARRQDAPAWGWSPRCLSWIRPGGGARPRSAFGGPASRSVKREVAYGSLWGREPCWISTVKETWNKFSLLSPSSWKGKTPFLYLLVQALQPMIVYQSSANEFNAVKQNTSLKSCKDSGTE